MDAYIHNLTKVAGNYGFPIRKRTVTLRIYTPARHIYILLYFYNLHVDVTRQLYGTDMTIKTYFGLSTSWIKPGFNDAEEVYIRLYFFYL